MSLKQNLIIHLNGNIYCITITVFEYYSLLKAGLINIKKKRVCDVRSDATKLPLFGKVTLTLCVYWFLPYLLEGVSNVTFIIIAYGQTKIKPSLVYSFLVCSFLASKGPPFQNLLIALIFEMSRRIAKPTK